MLPDQIDPRVLPSLIHGIITSQSIILQLLADQGLVSVSESRAKFDRCIRKLTEQKYDKAMLVPLTVIAEQLRLSEEEDEKETDAAPPDMSNFLTLIQGGLSEEEEPEEDRP